MEMGHFEKILSTLQSPALSVHPERCSKLRHKSSKCTSCSDKCPAEAIGWRDGILNVDPDMCTSCGICATACPNGVFEALKPSNMEILDQVKLLLSAQKEIVFECNPERADKQSRAIFVSCLGRIDEGLLISCVALGAEAVFLSPHECRGCQNESGLSTIQERMRNCNKLLECFGLYKIISFKDRTDVTADIREASRRELFATITQETKKFGAQIACDMFDSLQDKPAKTQKCLLPTYLSMKQELLVMALSKLSKLSKPVEVVLESPLFCQFGVKQGCTGCQMCAFFCPTGALSKFDEEDKFGVHFKASSCTGCGLCKDICYKQAVHLSRKVDLNKIINQSSDVYLMQKSSKTLPWEQDSRRLDFARSLAQSVLEEKRRDKSWMRYDRSR